MITTKEKFRYYWPRSNKFSPASYPLESAILEFYQKMIFHQSWPTQHTHTHTHPHTHQPHKQTPTTPRKWFSLKTAEQYLEKKVAVLAKNRIKVQKISNKNIILIACIESKDVLLNFFSTSIPWQCFFRRV